MTYTGYGAVRGTTTFFTLADVQEAYVEARVSRSGNFMPASGDLEGAADGKVAVGTQGVRVVITKQIP